MPTRVLSPQDIKPGDIYEDAYYHPCLCIHVNDTVVSGISLVDGSYPRTVDFRETEVRRLTPEEAWQWRLDGPPDAVLVEHQRWWVPTRKSRSMRSTGVKSSGAVWVS